MRVRLIVRTTGWVVVLPVLKRVLPLPRLVRLMHRPPRLAARDPARESEVVALLDRLYRYGRVPRRHNCLERSLIMYRYLSELAAEPALNIALARDRSSLTGHAWVVVDDHPVAERQHVIEQLEPWVVFGPTGTVTASSATVAGFGEAPTPPARLP